MAGWEGGGRWTDVVATGDGVLAGADGTGGRERCGGQSDQEEDGGAHLGGLGWM